METKANYAIVGFFTVLVIAAAFGFVYWMSNFGRQGEMAPLLVRIPGSANGLSVGSPVRFNGIQVGTVRGLTIDKSNPNYVVARNEVRTDAPVYETTKAILEIQGLTGSAYIELSGGPVKGPNLLEKALRTGEPAILEADPSSVTNILSTADKILTKVNHIVDQFDGFVQDARGPLTATIKNTQTFSQALADNSDGIDKFLASVSSLSDTIRNLSGRLDSTMGSIQKLVEAVDPDQVRDIVSNIDTVSKQFATASADLDETMASFRETAKTYSDVGRSAQKTLERVDQLIASIDPDKVGESVDNITAAAATARKSLADIAQVTATFSKHTDDIDQALTNFREIGKKLNAASTRVDAVLAKVNGFLGEGNAESLTEQARRTLESFKEVADTLNARIGPIADNLQQFSGAGLRNVQALVNELRQAVSRIENSVSSFEENPQRLIFGGDQVKQYDGRTRR
jgi:phospholipid/cholesterol/gamma-HCH transport system substrate-binding protein